MATNGTCASGVYYGLNLFGLTEYDYQCSFFGNGSTALPMSLGYIIICAIGGAFALATALVVWMVDRVEGQAEENSEHFSTAGRSIKMGLTACDIVSKWTWAATLLQSSNVAFTYGISGPFWYAAGATIQILLFSILAIEVKRKCPNIHTVLEIIKARWGFVAHIVFMIFCLLCNVIVTSMLILGGASVMHALSGVDVYAASFLIPLSVVLYTSMGGLRATYLASWSHVAIIYIALCIFMFKVYATDPLLGSPGKVWENLTLMTDSGRAVIKDNMGGSLLTMFSNGGLVFGVINIVGNFGTVFVDQAYWQSAIAARPSATYKGYLLGGLCWFAIPFSLATTLGLTARALDLPVSASEANQGLVPPAVAVELMGEGGAFLIALMLFMAVTASGSAEQIAVSSLFTYDIFREYLRPQATSEQLVLVSRIGVVAYGILSGVFAVILFKIGLSLGWVYLVMGIIIGPAVFPIAAALTWDKCSATAAITAAIVSQWMGIMTWLVTAATLNDGVVDLDTTGQNYPMLAGNLVSLLLSVIICSVISLIWPQNYDFAQMKISTDRWVIAADQKDPIDFGAIDSPEAMDKALKWTWWTGGVLTIVLIFAWPLLTLPAGVFSEGYWYWWVILAMIWGLIATGACILLPIYEAWDTWVLCFKCYILCQPIPSKLDTNPSISKALMNISNHPTADAATMEVALKGIDPPPVEPVIAK